MTRRILTLTLLFLLAVPAAWPQCGTLGRLIPIPLGGWACLPLPQSTSTPGYNPPALLSGGGVAWTSGLIFRVSAARYAIGGQEYTSSEGNITLDAADGALNRFDIIAVDTTGTVVKITGTAAANPATPDVAPDTQLQLALVYIPAGSATPGNITTTNIYHENTGPAAEWTASVSANLDAGSTNNPHAGTKDVEASAATTSNYVQFQVGTAVDLTTRSNLVFYIRSKAAWPKQRNLQLQFLNTGVPIRNTSVVLKDGEFLFSSSTTAAYQQIVIPLSTFTSGATTTTANQLKITVGGSGSTIGFYIDDVTLQGGVTTPDTYTLPERYTRFSCPGGMGDGVNAITAATYPMTGCYNGDGATWTVLGVRCYTDNNGTSTLDVTNCAGTSLLTGAITCTNTWAAGTQSATTTIASAGCIKFSFVADGTTKDASFWVGLSK